MGEATIEHERLTAAPPLVEPEDVLPGEARVFRAASESLAGERRGIRGVWPFLVELIVTFVLVPVVLVIFFGVILIVGLVASALGDKQNQVFFDASGTLQRARFIEMAVKAGKSIYCEKPTAVTTAEARPCPAGSQTLTEQPARA